MTEKLEARTLRWASRRMRLHERKARECQDEAESRCRPGWQKDSEYYMAKAHAYSNAATVFTLEARRLTPRKSRKKAK